jgi:hypothetical protein
MPRIRSRRLSRLLLRDDSSCIREFQGRHSVALPLSFRRVEYPTAFEFFADSYLGEGAETPANGRSNASWQRAAGNTLAGREYRAIAGRP